MTDPADGAIDKKEKDEEAVEGEPMSRGSRTPAGSRRSWSWRWSAAAALLVLGAGAGGFGYHKYRGYEDELAAMRQTGADQSRAVQLAKGYALKSLTYSFEDPDSFFASVEDGVSPALKDKYVNASELLKGIMLQAQVTSSGEILAAEATPQPGEVWQVVVSANQTTRNLQNPQQHASVILLQVTVNKVGGTWQISDIGPKTGSKPPADDQTLPAQPKAAETSPPQR